MRRATAIAALAAAAVLGTAQLVQADSATVTDARGDIVGEPPGGGESADIVAAAYGHTKSGKLWHKVTIAGQAADPAAGGGVLPLLYIDDDSGPGRGARECDFLVGRHDGRLGVFECGSLERVGSVRVTRTSEYSTRYVFSPKAIGNPDEYGWAFVTEGPSDGTWMRYDRVPEGDRAFRAHTLR
ncbi:MAG: hypothetical protein M3340_11600 [Actinomycetota bacterium]|nr:hypothetical protein [Actinomycetota bacterium]